MKRFILSILEGLLTVIVVVPTFIFKTIWRIAIFIAKVIILLAMFCGALYLWQLLESYWFLVPLLGLLLFITSTFILAFWKEKKFFRIFGVSSKKD